MMMLLVLLLVACGAVSSRIIRNAPIAMPYHRMQGIPALAQVERHENLISQGRIINGVLINPDTHPYTGGIIVFLLNNDRSLCGSTLLTDSRSLTAAHCWFDGENPAYHFTLVYGSRLLLTGGVRVDTKEVAMHEYWNTHTLENDIAVVSHRRLNFDMYISPIGLPSGNLLVQDFVGLSVLAIGYGRTSDFVPPPSNAEKSEVSLPVISNAICRDNYGEFVHHGNLCTDGIVGNICTGDSGGPLLYGPRNHSVLVGVILFGSHYGCQVGLPAVHTRVTAYVPWIRAHL